MNKPVAMNKVVIEGYKRTRKISITPSEIGLTTLAGKNAQGKTSVLDAICHGLLGPTYVDRMTEVINTDAEKIDGTRGARSRIQFELTDGTKIERRFTDKNSRTGILEVILPDGVEGSQETIADFFGSAALRPPSIESMSERERLRWLLGGLGIDISDLEEQYEKATADKEAAYQAKEQARRAFEDLPYHEDAPQALSSLIALTTEFEKAVDHNKIGENSHSEMRRANADLDSIDENIEDWKTQIARLNKKITATLDDKAEAEKRISSIAEKTNGFVQMDVDAIRAKMTNVESVNEKVRANKAKVDKEDESKDAKKAWKMESARQDQALAEMAERINGADVPIEAISVTFKNNQWVVTYGGQPWANMSGMERVIFRTAIASLYNPNARLVLVDGLESLDDEMQEEFNEWIIERGLQTIATEVSSKAGKANFTKLLIEDGAIKE